MKIVMLKYGESVFGENFIFAGGDKTRMLPIAFVVYLIVDGNRNILVDAGCNDGAGFVMSRFCRPSEALAEYGLRTEDITDVIITHSHDDHIEAVHEYANARIHIQREELAAGQKYLQNNRFVLPFVRRRKLTDGVWVERIGGHSAGSSVVHCLCGREYLLCGDECYYRENFERLHPTGSSCNPAISRGFLEKNAHLKERLLLFHDPGLMPGRLGFQVIAQTD